MHVSIRTVTDRSPTGLDICRSCTYTNPASTKNPTGRSILSRQNEFRIRIFRLHTHCDIQQISGYRMYKYNVFTSTRMCMPRPSRSGLYGTSQYLLTLLKHIPMRIHTPCLSVPPTLVCPSIPMRLGKCVCRSPSPAPRPGKPHCHRLLILRIDSIPWIILPQ